MSPLSTYAAIPTILFRPDVGDCPSERWAFSGVAVTGRLILGAAVEESILSEAIQLVGELDKRPIAAALSCGSYLAVKDIAKCAKDVVARVVGEAREFVSTEFGCDCSN